jgi:hypothetical protein
MLFLVIIILIAFLFFYPSISGGNETSIINPTPGILIDKPVYVPPAEKEPEPIITTPVISEPASISLNAARQTKISSILNR